MKEEKGLGAARTQPNRRRFLGEKGKTGAKKAEHQITSKTLPKKQKDSRRRKPINGGSKGSCLGDSETAFKALISYEEDLLSERN